VGEGEVLFFWFALLMSISAGSTGGSLPGGLRILRHMSRQVSPSPGIGIPRRPHGSAGRAV
jgi:hypothetical protein